MESENNQSIEQYAQSHPPELAGIDLMLIGGMGSFLYNGVNLRNREAMQKIEEGDIESLKRLFTPFGMLRNQPVAIQELNQLRAERAFQLGRAFPFLDPGHIDLPEKYILGIPLGQIDPQTNLRSLDINIFSLTSKDKTPIALPDYWQERSISRSYEPVFSFQTSSDHGQLSVRESFRTALH